MEQPPRPAIDFRGRAPGAGRGRRVRDTVTAHARAGTDLQRIAMLGNHAPRQCGIATFTTDLSQAMTDAYPSLECFVLAMNDVGKHHAYPERVRFEIDESEIASYRRAADFLNVNTVDVVSVQHEYGIFGGRAGSYLMALLRELRMPIVTTLHTLLAEPNPFQRAAMDEIIQLSERLVVMSANGMALLRDVHGVREEKIDLIPHGIPTVPSGRSSKDECGVDGMSVILTFGLLSPDKGIEHVIDALPAILAEQPNAVYIVLGATHPHVKERQSETYRLMLQSRAAALGVDSHIIFHDRFVSQNELVEFLSAADIYVTPYLKAEQITSGTLAYAVGSGKAVVSTPYSYARELLADGRGVLVPWRDSRAIAAAIVGLLHDDDRRHGVEDRARAYGRSMAWPVVAKGYLRSFKRARAEHAARRRTTFKAKTLAARRADFPEVNLDHLRVMTDGTGVLQHATFNVPRYDDGYCLDDNARALLVMALVEEGGLEAPREVRALASRYLGFVNHSFDGAHGRFRNFLSYGRQWTEDCGSEDSHGRALWALGSVIGRSGDPGRQSLAGHLFHAALPAAGRFSSPRACAYVLLAIDEYLHAFGGDRSVQSLRRVLAERLLDLHRRTRSDDWPWFEDRLTYCNARLPQALIVSGAGLADAAMTSCGLQALGWLATIQCSPDGYFAPIGSNGFYVRNGPRATFDQQPVEACAMVSACQDARRLTGDPRWEREAWRAFGWFLGQNQVQLPVYDPITGGCRDGLHAERVNENQGAESTLSFLLALLEMRAADRMSVLPSTSAPRVDHETPAPPAVTVS